MLARLQNLSLFEVAYFVKLILMCSDVGGCQSSVCMRVDLSPGLGGHTNQPNQPPHYCPPLIHLYSPPPAPPERCKVSQQVWNRVMN